MLWRDSIARTEIDEGGDLDKIQSRDPLTNGTPIQNQGGKKKKLCLCNIETVCPLPLLNGLLLEANIYLGNIRH
jgi:hypothetical protein